MKTGLLQLAGSVVLWFFLVHSAVTSAHSQGQIIFSRVLVERGSVWKFWNEEQAPPPDWKSAAFNDTDWKSGPAQLGYGDGDEATQTRTNSAPHPVSAYFRRSFVVTSTNLNFIELRMVRDDGAVVYINGQEILRDGMPVGEISHETLATSSADNENSFREFMLSGIPTHVGTNVIAVEVHQISAASSDLSFDLELIAKSAPAIPIVSIRATQTNTSEPLPNALVAPGRFEVSRSEADLHLPLRVALDYGGTATPADYEPLPAFVIIPAGARSVDLMVLPKADDLVEGVETVVARVVHRDSNDPAPENRPYVIASGNDFAEVRIADEDQDPTVPPVVRLVTIFPQTKEALPAEDVRPGQFRLQRTGNTNVELSVFVAYSGTAVKGRDYETAPEWVLFERGKSEVDIYIHAINDSLVEGVESVEARLTTPPTAVAFIRYIIHPEDNRGVVTIFDNDHPAVASLQMIEPRDGAVYPVGQSIDVSAVAIDRLGYIPRVSFQTEGGILIGVSEIAFLVPPEPGTPITHTVTWNNPPVGEHSIYAVARDSQGNTVQSERVRIEVKGLSQIPVVGVRFVPHQTTEPWPDADFAPGTFEFFRRGPTNTPLSVYFETGGTATKGVDYVALDNVITIPAGRASTHLRVEAIDDLRVEGDETVIAELQPFLSSSHYLIDPTNRTATLTILDNDETNAPARLEILRPRDGQRFPIGTDIRIGATAVDPNGYIPRVEFYANNALIATSVVVFIQAPAPGTPVYHEVVWSNAPAGEHLLRAAATDSLGRRVSSQAVRIFVGPESTNRVVLTLESPDPEAAEVEADGTTDRAVFVIRRSQGPTNVAVSAYYSISGTAQNGIDYEELSGTVLLREGQTAAEIFVRPIPDKAIEGEETVVLGLRAVPCLEDFPNPGCYLIGSPSEARAVIRDGVAGTNLPPRATITVPRDGAVFEPGQRIDIRAEATDRDGRIAQLEVSLDGRLLWRTNTSVLMYAILSATPGEHTLVARAVDNAGAVGESAPVRILVRESSRTFVERDLPDAFVPGVPFQVSLIANPPDGTRAWAVEDQPPRGWAVSAISHGGVFDAATGKVKFGHFSDAQDRRLTYTVTPPANANEGTFTGSSSADGAIFAIRGDTVIRGGAQETHPADTNRDKRIVLGELTGYAAAWKSGSNDATRLAPIPVRYVTRAAMIWRNGETYHFVPSMIPPLCWVPDAENVRALVALESTAVRSASPSPDQGATRITITVQPANGVGAFALEERVPAGWTVSAISDDGAFHSEDSVIRWGVFMDSAARELKYTLTAPGRVTTVAQFSGDASFDGETQAITGIHRLVTTDGANVLRLPHCERRADGRVHMKLAGAPGQLCVLEASEDLSTWTSLGEVFLPDGELDVVDDPGTNPRRYYRLRVR